jgi:signal transduction histidine kinase
MSLATGVGTGFNRALIQVGTRLGLLEFLARRDEPHLIKVERSLVVVRWLAVVIVALAAPFAGLSPSDLEATYTVVALGALYTLALQLLVIERHPGWLSGGYLTSLAEAALSSLAVLASGGAASPLFLAYFLVVVTAAVRFRLRASLIAAAASIGLYTLVAVLHPRGAVPAPGELALRGGFLVLAGMLAGYLAQEVEESRRALATELARTKELHRASAALARENAELSAHLRDHLEELARTQDQLIEAAKLAAIGRLAANVAHEINNPLTAVLTNAELLLEDLPADSPARADLLTVRDEALRARDIVRHLLDSARQSLPTLEQFEPRSVLEGVISLVQKRAASAGVQIHQSHAPEPLPIVADVGQIKQVFINLLTNAIDAMPDGGDLFITTGRERDKVVIAVRDTGTGILPEHRDRIFEPFFTTKSAVSGIGLGLAVSYGIVEHHGGRLTVDSTPGAGSTFCVYLPMAVDRAPNDPGWKSRAAASTGGA